jgi:hypothetical protein
MHLKLGQPNNLDSAVMKHIALFLLVMSHYFIQDSFADERKPGYNIVHGTVVRIDKSSAPTRDAWVSITKIYGKVKADVTLGDEFRMHTGNLSGPNGEPPPGNDFSLVSPELKVGETGIWAMVVDVYGNKIGDSFGMYGRAWPSIKGRDPSFEAVELWAKELDDDAARQEDYDGERWPAPDPRNKSHEISPTSAPNAQSTPAPTPPPVVQQPTPTPTNAPESKHPPTPTEEPTSSTPWSIVVAILAASGLLWLLLKRRS